MYADLHALLRISKVLMVASKMFLVPWILLHALVILDPLKDDLAKAIERRDVTHLRVKKLGHEGTSGALVMDLISRVSTSRKPVSFLTGVCTPASIF